MGGGREEGAGKGEGEGGGRAEGRQRAGRGWAEGGSEGRGWAVGVRRCGGASLLDTSCVRVLLQPRFIDRMRPHLSTSFGMMHPKACAA